MKEKVTASLLITTYDYILVQDIGDKVFRLPTVTKRGRESLQACANLFASKLHHDLKVGGILFVVEERRTHKGLLFESLANETSFVFNVKTPNTFKVKNPYAWLNFDHFDQLDIAEDLKQIIVSNQVIKSSVPLINLNDSL